MFTGIIEEIGKVRHVCSGAVCGEIDIEASRVLEGTKLGDSIAVNGVCLTVTRIHGRGFAADVMPETLRRSNLGGLRAGAGVNLERAMAAGGRFGGHMVSGHIDGVGMLSGQSREGNAVRMHIKAPCDILRLIVEKGSIAIDGISLTVAAVNETGFEVSVIPHTGSETTLLGKRPGDTVNLENDIVGKYVQKLLLPGERREAGQSGLTLEFLKEHGF